MCQCVLHVQTLYMECTCLFVGCREPVSCSVACVAYKPVANKEKTERWQSAWILIFILPFLIVVIEHPCSSSYHHYNHQYTAHV